MFLGIHEDLSLAHEGLITLKPKPEFVETVSRSIADALASGILVPGDAASLRGKLIHLSKTTAGRSGRGQTFAFQEHIAGYNTTISKQLKLNLEFHAALLKMAISD